ncbi:MAG: glyoxalase [Euryarchaeota archaeon RBG_19FT_COMBO_56_21]|nr:MAG: glyoxalase [Euryarchaeota archaeon RBG_19FT_COMBO_56_21]
MSSKVVHFEIPADDMKRAKEFYKKAFGWKLDDVPGMDYTMVGTTPSNERGMPSEPGAINGGMMKRQEPVKNLVITIGVEDLEDAIDVVKKAGGKIVRHKTVVGDMGFSAYFSDTEGNLVGLWQNARRP